jgi:hypothetical protein
VSRFGRDSTACECGYRRVWPNGPCTNQECRHFRRPTPWRERIMFIGTGFALSVALRPLGLWLSRIVRDWFGW